MENIWQALDNTPWWVYVLFVYLIMIGIKASKRNVVSIYKLAILPILFTVMSFNTLIYSFQVTVFSVSIWIAAILLGSIIGLINYMRFTIRVDKTKKLVELPGTWSTLIIILFIFASKYYLGYTSATDPDLLKNTIYEIIALSISGICAGLFIGRISYYFHQLITKESVELKET